jgi:hypothetical protein
MQIFSSSLRPTRYNIKEVAGGSVQNLLLARNSKALADRLQNKQFAFCDRQCEQKPVSTAPSGFASATSLEVAIKFEMWFWPK